MTNKHNTRVVVEGVFAAGSAEDLECRLGGEAEKRAPATYAIVEHHVNAGAPGGTCARGKVGMLAVSWKKRSCMHVAVPTMA